MNVSNEFKLATKKIKQQKIKLSVIDEELTVDEINIMPVSVFNSMPVWKLREDRRIIAKELKYSFEGSLFKTIMKQIDITAKNADILREKDINFKYGLYVENKYEYIDLGEFHIKDIEENKGKETYNITAYDKMLYFMKQFKQSELNIVYPCTILDLINRICEVCGVELYSANFFNSNLIVNEDFFTTQEITYRDVLEKVAQATLTTIFIKKDKLYLHKISNEVEETLDRSYLTKLNITDKFGPINALVLGRGDVEDNVEESDEESIAQNGRYQIRFDENEFVEYQRENVIKTMFSQINGLEYYSFEASDLGIMWLEPCTCIALKNSNTDIYKSYYLSANIKINTGISADIEAEILEQKETKYKVKTEQEKKTLKVERLAKKNEGLIQDIVEENSKTAQKYAEIKLTVDGIEQKVSNIEDLTRTAEGTTLTLGNCVEGDLLELHIRGNNTVFDSLYASEDLYASDDLYVLGDSEIVVTNNNKSTTYELNVSDVLRQNSEVYDEYILKSGQAQVIRRVNKSGTTKAKESIENLGAYSIRLGTGTNTIKIKNYTAQMEAKYVIKSDYTDAFATKVEMNSNIEQTAQNINLNVNKKLENYSTTQEMNSAINLKADSITSTVSNTYATKTELSTAKSEIKQTTDSITSTVSKKVGNNEIISKINQSSETVGINANKIELSANDVLNLLSGNEINLSGKKIKIASNNFSVDENGNMTCTNANVSGTISSNNATITRRNNKSKRW